MDILINIGHHSPGSEDVVTHYTEELERTLGRFSDRILLVEAHLSDENAEKSGLEDKSCMIEVRLRGLQPLTVTNRASTGQRALDGAGHKMVRLIESTLGRLHDEDLRPVPQADASGLA